MRRSARASNSRTVPVYWVTVVKPGPEGDTPMAFDYRCEEWLSRGARIHNRATGQVYVASQVFGDETGHYDGFVEAEWVIGEYKRTKSSPPRRT